MTSNEKLDLLLNGQNRAVMLFGQPGGGMISSAVRRQPTAPIFTVDRSTFLCEVFAFLKQNANKTVIIHTGSTLDTEAARSSTHAYNECYRLAYLLTGAFDGKVMYSEGSNKQEVAFTGSIILLSYANPENAPKIMRVRSNWSGVLQSDNDGKTMIWAVPHLPGRPEAVSPKLFRSAQMLL